jgi:NAD(P)-dependent dehydrogenase (short-subunit alcohol dehydrogenase family)
MSPTRTACATCPSFRDRSVFITGGADGIGRALVEQFARQPCRRRE